MHSFLWGVALICDALRFHSNHRDFRFNVGDKKTVENQGWTFFLNADKHSRTWAAQLWQEQNRGAFKFAHTPFGSLCAHCGALTGFHTGSIAILTICTEGCSQTHTHSTLRTYSEGFAKKKKSCQPPHSCSSSRDTSCSEWDKESCTVPKMQWHMHSVYSHSNQ